MKSTEESIETMPVTDYPRHASIHQLFDEIASRYAEQTAILFGEERLVYAALQDRANRLAHFLQARGVRPGDHVGILMDRSADQLVGLLAILKAGGAYVPLDPAYPAERLVWMIEDASVKVLLTTVAHANSHTDAQADLVCIDTDADEIQAQPGTSPDVAVDGGDLAYIMYTSGSTGKPKGVCVPHRAVCRLVRNTNYIDILSSDRIAQASNSSFDAATFEIWGALLNGACVVGVERDDMLSPKRLEGRLREDGITTLFLTTALFNQVARERPHAFSGLKHLLFGGEAVDPHWVRVILEQAPPERLLHVYGPTESTTFATWHLVEHVAPGATTIPIGKPLSNTEMLVLDSEMQRVEPGGCGELYVGGDGLAHGYLDRPELTAERFVGHPFAAALGARLYRTGDLVCLLPDGSVEFRGRIDNQVKIRGFRVEPGEIETVLLQHPAVRECVVVARDDMGEPGHGAGKQLVAYLVEVASRKADASELRSYLGERLPQYMVPSAFVVLAELPLNVNGKVDREALPRPGEGDVQQASFAAPQTHVEKMLAAIWCEVLGVDRIGVTDDFMDRGGHSLHAARVLTRIGEVFQVELPIYELFEKTRLGDLADVIEEAQRGGEAMASAPMQPVPRTGDLPLTFAQERVWFMQNMDPDIIAYHFQAAIRLKGALDVATLERALSEIIARHEVFRTTFPVRDGRPAQEIQDPFAVVLDVRDLTYLPEQEQQEAFRTCITREMQDPFDLTRLPLVRWTLFKLGDEDHVLGQVEHHLVHDGWSFNVFIRELLDLYAHFAGHGPSALPALPIQFADFASWQRDWMKSDAAAAQKAYWSSQLVGMPPVLDLPFDKPRPAVQSFKGASFKKDLPLDLCDEVRAFSKSEGATLFAPLLQALAILLYRYTGQDDVPIGCGIANRRWRETEDLLGMIINNVVMRTDCSGEQTVRSLLDRLRVTALDAYAHQDLPFDSVVESVHPERNLSHNPLFQVIFGLHDAPMPALEIPGLTVEVEPGMGNGSAKFDLTLIVIPKSAQLPGITAGEPGDGLTMLWEFNTDLFERATVDRMATHYQRILEAIVRGPDVSIDGIDLLGEDEQRDPLAAYNLRTHAYPHDRTVHELFEQQAVERPDATAVVYGDQVLSYAELNTRANQVANYLIERGAGRDTKVGICAERSVQMVVAMLAVLKSGGAYVPLDPEVPAHRIAYILKDTAAPIVLAQKDVSEILGSYEGDIIPLDGDTFEVCSRENPAGGSGARDLAYVMYTSGSTGTPKGVCIEHRSINRLVCHADYVDIGPEDVMAQISNCAFDASTYEIWGALLSGARLVGLSKETVLNPRTFAEALRDHQVSVLFLTTALFNQTVREAPGAFEGVRHLTTGGEAVDPDAMRSLLADRPPEHLVHVYGPTESTTFASWYEVAELADDAVTVPIGQPIANTTLHVLDAHMNPLPVGVAGELYVGGDGLARGYLNAPELTAEKFVPDPFSDEDGARLYRTGDRVRYGADGMIEFLGRFDTQVKLRGFRVELGEIEAVLRRHPGIREALVVLQDDARGREGRYLAAYIIPEDGHEPSGETLRKCLGEELPDYMVPTAYLSLDAIPLTPNGKVDRRALPEPTRVVAESEHAYVAPESEVERAICGIWKDVLGVERVGVHDNFFDMGGNSLLLMQVQNRIRDSLDANLSIVHLFSHPTIASLAEHVSGPGNGSDEAQRFTI